MQGNITIMTHEEPQGLGGTSSTPIRVESCTPDECLIRKRPKTVGRLTFVAKGNSYVALDELSFPFATGGFSSIYRCCRYHSKRPFSR